MSKFTKARSREQSPAAEAIHFYGEAFEVHSREDLAETMADWSELTQEEQSFATTHLLYLGVQQGGRLERVLEEVRELLEDWLDDPDDVVVPELVEEAPPAPPTLEVVPEPEVVLPEVLVPEEVPDDAA